MRQPFKYIKDSTELFLRNISLPMKKVAANPLDEAFGPVPGEPSKPELPKLPELPPVPTPAYQDMWKKWNEELQQETERTKEFATPPEQWNPGDRFVLMQNTYATDLLSILGPAAAERTIEDIVSILVSKYHIPLPYMESILPPAIDGQTFLSIFNIFSLAKLAQVMKMVPATTFASLANTEGVPGIENLLNMLPKKKQEEGQEPPVPFSTVVSWAEQSLFGHDAVANRRSWKEDKRKGIFSVSWVFKQQPLTQPEWKLRPELAIDWQMTLISSRKMRIKMEWNVSDLVPEFIVEWTEFGPDEEGNILPGWYNKFNQATEFVSNKLAGALGGGKAPQAIKLSKPIVMAAESNQFKLKAGTLLEYLGRVSDIDTIFPREDNPLSIRIPDDTKMMATELMIFGRPGRNTFPGQFYVFSMAAPPMLKRAQLTTNQAPGHGGQTEGTPAYGTDAETEKLEADDLPRIERKKKDLGVNDSKGPTWKMHGNL